MYTWIATLFLIWSSDASKVFIRQAAYTGVKLDMTSQVV